MVVSVVAAVIVAAGAASNHEQATTAEGVLQSKRPFLLYTPHPSYIHNTLANNSQFCRNLRPITPASLLNDVFAVLEHSFNHRNTRENSSFL